jgi:hypothetical protein
MEVLLWRQASIIDAAGGFEVDQLHCHDLMSQLSQRLPVILGNHRIWRCIVSILLMKDR